jgi:hypothetical protein
VFWVLPRTSEPSSCETMDGLAGRIWWRNWSEVGSLSLWVVQREPRSGSSRVVCSLSRLHLTDDWITVA